MRLRQDLLGCANRIRSLRGELDKKSGETFEKWKDATAESFDHDYLQPIHEVLQRLMITLHEANELATKCDRTMSDPDYE